MKNLTSSENCSVLENDSIYLAWSKMKWKIVGEVTEYDIPVPLCSSDDNSVSIFFTSTIKMHEKTNEYRLLKIQSRKTVEFFYYFCFKIFPFTS